MAAWRLRARRRPRAEPNPDTAKDRKGSIELPNYPPMLADFEKKYEWDFHEGWELNPG
jgi:hypothetical protein